MGGWCLCTDQKNHDPNSYKPDRIKQYMVRLTENYGFVIVA